MKIVPIISEDYRDKAWGIADLNNGKELVLEMTCGYSDLYFRNAVTKQKGMVLFEEETGHGKINEYCERMYGFIFKGLLG